MSAGDRTLEGIALTAKSDNHLTLFDDSAAVCYVTAPVLFLFCFSFSNKTKTTIRL